MEKKNKKVIIALWGDYDGAYMPDGGITVEKFLNNDYKFIRDDEYYNHFEAEFDFKADSPILQNWGVTFYDDYIVIEHNDCHSAIQDLKEYNLI